ncbi:hypothetical protein MMC34_007560 [Xylographa carneopallida]|nr:hypothetical protein [Xylographa carneopallida]
MIFDILLIIALTIVVPESFTASARVVLPSHELPIIKNANHIFNAIHSSMRQWGSSLNHNGMSFFPAFMPAGTELYHGTGTPDPVEVMEWLAFEPEHALNFAWQFPDPAVNSYENHHSLSIKWLLDTDLTSGLMQQNPETGRDDFFNQFQDGLQHPILYKGRPPSSEKQPSSRRRDELETGWLHTYVMKRDLHLVYIDGQSAAKSSKGTLDSQDLVFDLGVKKAPWLDRPRALHMCKIAKEEWNGRVDGFVRMEHGFELILCDFKSNADMIRAERAMPEFHRDLADATMANFWFWKAIAARYHGIGSKRVSLDYSRMVTAFAYDIDLFSNQTDLPRLKYASRDDRSRIFADLSESIINDTDQPIPQWTDWQAVTDMIVARYSDPLHELAYSPFYNSKKHLEVEIFLLLRPFIDYDDRNTTLETERCASHFMPSNYTSSIPSAAVSSISLKICSTMFVATEQNSLDEARHILQGLVEYLAWTSWKECRGCRRDELCFTAICMYLSKYPSPVLLLSRNSAPTLHQINLR